jgi:hypothetical protein
VKKRQLTICQILERSSFGSSDLPKNMTAARAPRYSADRGGVRTWIVRGLGIHCRPQNFLKTALNKEGGRLFTQGRDVLLPNRSSPLVVVGQPPSALLCVRACDTSIFDSDTSEAASANTKRRGGERRIVPTPSGSTTVSHSVHNRVNSSVSSGVSEIAISQTESKCCVRRQAVRNGWRHHGTTLPPKHVAICVDMMC